MDTKRRTIKIYRIWMRIPVKRRMRLFMCKKSAMAFFVRRRITENDVVKFEEIETPGRKFRWQAVYHTGIKIKWLSGNQDS